MKKTKEDYLFLDVLTCRKCDSIVTNVFWKPTNNDIYLNGDAFAWDTLKRGTLKTLVEDAHIMISINELLQKELKYLEKVFHETNNYPQYIKTLRPLFMDGVHLPQG